MVNAKDIIGINVTHSTLGSGKVIGSSVIGKDEFITVEFESKTSKFQFPHAFGRKGFLKTDDRKVAGEIYLQSQSLLKDKGKETSRSLDESIARWNVESERRKLEKKKERAAAREAKRRTEKKVVLGKGDSFVDRQEAMKCCFGLDAEPAAYGVQRVDGDYTAWFFTVTDEQKGSCVIPDDARGMQKIISDDCTKITECECGTDKPKNRNRGIYGKDRYTFVRYPGSSKYVFIGVFRPENEGRLTDGRFESHLVSEDVDLFETEKAA